MSRSDSTLDRVIVQFHFHLLVLKWILVDAVQMEDMYLHIHFLVARYQPAELDVIL